jgi:hypothetical protein
MMELPKAYPAWKAILIGQVMINVPVTIIILGVTAVALQIIGSQGGRAWLSLFIGIVMGWCWWSFTVPRWRRWALSKGIPADKLHRMAVATLLVAPKGSWFEKTEFKIKARDRDERLQ